VPKANSGKSTQSFIGKELTFAGNKGEDQEKIADNWPWPQPPLNNQEDMAKYRKSGKIPERGKCESSN